MSWQPNLVDPRLEAIIEIPHEMRKTEADAKVLALESRCKGAHDLIPTAHRFAQELRRLHDDGYDVASVTIWAAVVRDDRPVIPKARLTLVDDELLERYPASRRRANREL